MPRGTLGACGSYCHVPNVTQVHGNGRRRVCTALLRALEDACGPPQVQGVRDGPREERLLRVPHVKPDDGGWQKRYFGLDSFSQENQALPPTSSISCVCEIRCFLSAVDGVLHLIACDIPMNPRFNQFSSLSEAHKHGTLGISGQLCVFHSSELADPTSCTCITPLVFTGFKIM